MIERIYIDNFRCLVNFELKLDPINLFLGVNGSGKSSVFDVLRRLQFFIEGAGRIQEAFSPTFITRWQKQQFQTFEMDISGNGGLYHYRLVVEHDIVRNESRVKQESVYFSNRPLYEFDGAQALIFTDDHNESGRFPFDWSYSGLAMFQPRPDNQLLMWFKRRMQRLLVIRINPFNIEFSSPGEDTQPLLSMENFPSWYRYLSQEYQGRVFELTKALQEVIPGFDSFRLAQYGVEHRLLKLVFRAENRADSPVEYTFNEISEGQRALVILFTVLHCILVEETEVYATVCVDEPDNFVALPEIQPWLMQLYDRCSPNGHQALLISHHPEYIDYLADSVGWLFTREMEGPVRLKRIDEKIEGGLKISEHVARGWIDE